MIYDIQYIHRYTVCSVGNLLSSSVILHAGSFCFANDILRSVTELEGITNAFCCVFVFQTPLGCFLTLTQTWSCPRVEHLNEWRKRWDDASYYFTSFIETSLQPWSATLEWTCISKISRLVLGWIHTWSRILRKTLFGTAGTDRMLSACLALFQSTDSMTLEWFNGRGNYVNGFCMLGEWSRGRNESDESSVMRLLSITQLCGKVCNIKSNLIERSNGCRLLFFWQARVISNISELVCLLHKLTVIQYRHLEQNICFGRGNVFHCQQTGLLVIELLEV